MTFAAYETSREKGSPINLYRFSITGTDIVYGFTDSEVQRDFRGVLYESIAIDRDSIRVSADNERVPLEVRLPTKNPVVDLFRFAPPSYVVELDIFNGHFDDPDAQFMQIWFGRILNCKPDTPEAVLIGDPLTATMARNGLRRQWQYGCMHPLYGPDCRAPKIEFPATAVSVTDNRLRITAPANADPAHFRAGMIQWTGVDTKLREIRNIRLAMSSGTDWIVEVGGANYNLPPAGARVVLYRGCAHTEDACRNVHNNILNYGGCKWIPLKNPVGLGTPFI